MTLASACTKQKPALDEGSFQQLLAAAFVVQEHSRALRTRVVQASPAPTAPKSSEIAEIQSTVHAGGLNLSEAAKLITDRLLTLLRAGGVSISLVSNGYLDCVAESGAPANVPGSSLASHSLVATERLKSGEIFDSSDSQTDIRLDCNMCSGLRVEALVAAPILRFGEIAGLIEVRWQQANAFQDEDLSTIKLMADLMTEMLEQQVPADLASEGRIEPQEPAGAQSIAEPQVEAVPVPDEAPPISEDNSIRILPVETQEVRSSELAHAADPTSESISSASGLSCRVCGHPFHANEAFCGHCSMPRVAVTPSEGLQSKWASLWFIQKAKSALEEEEDRYTDAGAQDERFASLPEDSLTPETNDESIVLQTEGTSPHGDFSYFKPTTDEYRDVADLDSMSDEPWPREAWPKIVQSVRNRLRLRDVVLALVAAALTFGVVSAWPTSTGQLTWFQSAMVRLGLEQSSVPSPVYGNPDASVWIDPQSKLYYCDGSDLYGNTANGHFSTQRKAQLDRFESATGLACQ